MPPQQVETHPVGRLDFDHLYRTHQGRLYQQALHMLGRNTWDSEDAAAEAWLTAWEQRDQWTDAGKPPLAWLTTLVKYAALATIRDRKPVVEADGEDREWVDNSTPYPGLCDPQTHEALQLVWPALTEVQATAVWLRHIGGYTLDEMARVMGVPKSSAQNNADEGLRKIRRFFAEPGFRFTRGCPSCGWPRKSVGHRSVCG